MARILVIDDDINLRKMLGQALELAGYEVALAADGREGVASFRAQPTDVVITDLYMPNQEGLETIMELHRDFPAVPIIAMSGKRPAGALLSVAQRLGAVGILEKSFSADELLAAVEHALQRERSGQSG